MQAALDDLMTAMFGTSNTEAGEQRICIQCKAPAGEFRDELSAKEYEISRLCQACQDVAFAPMDEDEEGDDDPAF
jgi:hypothetical protein